MQNIHRLTADKKNVIESKRSQALSTLCGIRWNVFLCVCECERVCVVCHVHCVCVLYAIANGVEMAWNNITWLVIISTMHTAIMACFTHFNPFSLAPYMKMNGTNAEQNKNAEFPRFMGMRVLWAAPGTHNYAKHPWNSTTDQSETFVLHFQFQ